MPRLHELPRPKTDRQSWPWTEETQPLPECMPDGSAWPKISIVTPSFNQGQYLEETIRSVLLQGYPNLEYIVMDGGSTDGSSEIITAYGPWLAYWKSEPDQGQSDALASGFRISSGEIMAWINSDDYYEPGVFRAVAEAFHANPDIYWLAGRCLFLDKDGNKTMGWGKPEEIIEQCFVWNNLMQPGIFWRRSLWQQVKGIDAQLRHSMDYDLWFQFRHIQKFPYWLDIPLAYFRKHPESKTTLGGEHIAQERALIHRRNRGLLLYPWQIFLVKYYVRDFYAHRIINQEISDKSGFLPALSEAIAMAPWILFQKKLYSKILHYYGFVPKK